MYHVREESPLHVHIGLENYINSDHVFAVARNKGATMKRLRCLAEKEGRYYPLTGGYATKSLIFMDNGTVFGSCITAKTLASRINTARHAIAAGDRVQTSAMTDHGDGDNDEYLLDDTYAAESEDEEWESEDEDEYED